MLPLILVGSNEYHHLQQRMTWDFDIIVSSCRCW